jgi:uncharacterized protein YfaS (alpha-2-macroglobulin family)
MKKNRLYLLFMLCSCILFWMNGCQKPVPTEEFAPYISAYTAGLIKSNSSIIIELTESCDWAEVDAEIQEKLFSFSPSIKGKTYWKDEKTIEFVPERGVLKNGKTYKAVFFLDKVIKTTQKFKKFKFEFRVEPLYFSMNELLMLVQDDGDIQLETTIVFNETVDTSKIDKIVDINYDGDDGYHLQITPIDNKKFNLIINNIKRSEQDLLLQLNINGKAVGCNQIESKSCLIPANNFFKIVDNKIYREDDTYLLLTFSEQIDPEQNLEGLIQLSEISESADGYYDWETDEYVSEFNFVFEDLKYTVERNRIKVFFDPGNSMKKLQLFISKELQSKDKKNLSKDYTETLDILSLKPQVEFLSKGVILPHTQEITLPFKAVNLCAVDVKVFRIYENNVLRFLQSDYSSSGLNKVGRLIYKKTMSLKPNDGNYATWQNYSLDLSKIVNREPGAIYRIELLFNRSYSTYHCDGDNLKTGVSNLEKISPIDEMEENLWDTPSFYYYGSSNDNWYEYRWNERDDPCCASYYMDKGSVSTNILASNIGVIVKGNSEGKLWVSVANIITTQALANTEITVYNYQLQAIGHGKTDNSGFAMLTPKGKAFALVAQLGKEKTYIRLADGEENSTSRFDVGGKSLQKGLKGYIYGERGIWRPGDTLFLTFVLHDAEHKIPDTHPVSLELYNATGQFYLKQTSTDGINGFYAFKIPTSSDDGTGLWNAYVKVGGASFHKSLRIETIKPNRLKIDCNLGVKQLDASKGALPVKLSASWLTGAIACNLQSRVELSLHRTNTQFKGYESYVFNTPSNEFETSATVVYEGKLNENGKTTFLLEMPAAEHAPGMLNAVFTTRVFEPGGDASISTQTLPFSPYTSYVGLNTNRKKDDNFVSGKQYSFDVVSLSPDGKPVNKHLEYKIYHIGWNWWWQTENEFFGEYISSNSYKVFQQGEIQTQNGKATFKFGTDESKYGRFLILVQDVASGHITGEVVYFSSPYYFCTSHGDDPDGIKMLSFSSDKKSYQAGEEATIILPASAGGMALVCLENGKTVLDRKWIKIEPQKETQYHFKVTREMLPNIYVHVSFLQPYEQNFNDLPIRMYGVIPIMIEDKTTQLEPVLTIPASLQPETEFTVKVSEKNARAMTYTLAIVDEGLLDLTNFKTPNPWNEFYIREALGIKTWDMYDQVIGAFSGSLGGMLSIGGDGYLKRDNEKANRFRPVVKYLGPFTLEKAKTNAHSIKLPMYVGSVRVMLVAGQDGAYGNAEKTLPVHSPLMLLSSLPRTLSVNEEIALPVNVFVMEKGVKNVDVSVKTENGLAAVSGESNKKLSFSTVGDQMLYFTVKTKGKTGKEKITVTASGGGKTTKEIIEIDVRNPNPPVILAEYKILNGNQKANFDYTLISGGTDNWLRLEVSRIPSVDISRRLDFLYHYQHYCSEQVTSRALSMLYLPQFKDLNKKEEALSKENIKNAIQALYARQTSSGGFLYWQSSSYPDEWITSYVGEFLLKAKEKGYTINKNVLDKWKNFQQQAARSWTANTQNEYDRQYSEIDQAYRLYTLVLAGASESGAMNRLQQNKNLCVAATWRLALAYMIDGKKSIAEKLIFNLAAATDDYYSYGYSFNDALILQNLIALNRLEDAFKLAQKISIRLSKEYDFTTNTTAAALMAMGDLADKTSGTISYDWTLNGKAQPFQTTQKSLLQIDLPTSPAKGKLSLTNKEKGVLYVNLISCSTPLTDTLPAISENLDLRIHYTLMDGTPCDIRNLKQGTDFQVIINVENTNIVENYTNLALTYLVPSGWEIYNERIHSEMDASGNARITYQDIRDDRVLSYFDLQKAQKISLKIRLQASYIGDYNLPAIQCSAMYDPKVQARTQAGRVKVVK